MKTMSVHTMCAQKVEWRKKTEGNIVLSLKLHDVFQDGGDTLKKITNKDVVTPEIR